MQRKRLTTALGAALVASLIFPTIGVASETPSSASPFTVHVQAIEGTEMISISGSAPATSNVRLKTIALLSQTIPDVLLSDTTIVADANGRYQTTVSLAPDHWYGSLLRVSASTTDSDTPYSAKVEFRESLPNPNVHVRSDMVPRN